MNINSSTDKARKRFKKHFDRSVEGKPKYSSGDDVFTDILAGHTSRVEEIEQETLKKLQSQKKGPFKVTSVQSRTVTLDEDRIENILSIDRVSLARRKGEVDQPALGAEHQCPERAVFSETPPVTLPKKVEYVVD